MKEYLLIFVGAALVNNFVLSRFLGICPFLGVSKRVPTALGMSGAVVFVMGLAAAVTWPLDRHVLAPRGLEYLRTIAFILVIASLVQLVDMALKKTARPLHAALGIFLPLITTNCAVLGVALENMRGETTRESFARSVVFAVSAAAGFGLALLVFAGLREKIDRADPPRAFRGAAIALVTAGLLSLAFMGFKGLAR
ncbi:MAG: electron transport complex subunit RsxA [Kiritimatiellaeota bacterium]|nr:electron transport complex subunit RsxA [Kiritimatiellota bacterium]